MTQNGHKRVLLAAPRSFCAGVDRASGPDSMSAASAPVRSWSRRRSTGSSITASTATIVPVLAPSTPSGPPSQRIRPSESTTRVASSTSPHTSPSWSPPASPNEITGPSGTPRRAPIPTSAVSAPSLRAARSSVLVAQANVIR